MTPDILDTAGGFMLVLKRYEKLNFALFLDMSPLLWALMKVIDSIKFFSHSTAAITWLCSTWRLDNIFSAYGVDLTLVFIFESLTKPER